MRTRIGRGGVVIQGDWEAVEEEEAQVAVVVGLEEVEVEGGWAALTMSEGRSVGVVDEFAQDGQQQDSHGS